MKKHYEGSIATVGTEEWSEPVDVMAGNEEIAAQRVIEAHVFARFAENEEELQITVREVSVDGEPKGEWTYFLGKAWPVWKSEVKPYTPSAEEPDPPRQCRTCGNGLRDDWPYPDCSPCVYAAMAKALPLMPPGHEVKMESTPGETDNEWKGIFVESYPEAEKKKAHQPSDFEIAIKLLAESLIWIAPIGNDHGYFLSDEAGVRQPVPCPIGYMACKRSVNNYDGKNTRVDFLRKKGKGWKSPFKQDCLFLTMEEAIKEALNHEKIIPPASLD